jgi:DNA polymerase III sliding clamp (beta) subunit (PCNA family)
MKVTLNTKTLAHLLAIVGKAVALDLVKMEACGGQFSAMCFNGTSGFSGTIQAVSLDIWSAHVSLSTLIALIGTLESESIDLELTEKSLVISARPARMEIRLSNEELPGIPAISGETLVLSGKQFMKITGVSAFASTDLAHPVLTGIHIYTKENGIFADAADGYALGRVQIPGKFASLDMLLPGSFAKETGKVIKPDDQLEFTSNHSHAAIRLHREGETYIFATSLIDGTYPDVEQIIPKTFKTEVNLANNGPMLTFVRRSNALKMSNEKLAVLLHIRPAPDSRLRVFCQVGSGQEVTGTTMDEIPVKSEKGLEVKVKLDPHYIGLACEFLAAPATIQVVNHIANTPVLLNAGDRLVVIMPLISDSVSPDLYGDGILVVIPTTVKTEIHATV